MNRLVLFSILTLSLLAPLKTTRSQSPSELTIDSSLSLKLDGHCVPARFMKKPLIIPKQKCRIG